MELKIGDEIPSFQLKDQEGKMFDIDSLKGQKKMVIYFYPKDDTPGCTKEACSFRDSYQDFKDLDCEVIGISSDSIDKHQKFAQKHNLPFILLSDADKSVRKKFGVKGNLFGLIPGRETFVVDQNGIIVHKLNALFESEKHMQQAKEEIKKLN